MPIYHKHHIIPKHMGGTDDPSNLVSVTVEEHANLHKQLWEDLGHEEDKIAWLCLSGQISTSEATILAIKKANTGRKMFFTEEHRQKLRESRKKQKPPRLGKTTSDETRKKMSEARKLRWKDPEYKKHMSQRFSGKNNPMFGKTNKGYKHTQEFKKHLSEINSGKNNSMYGKTHTDNFYKIKAKKIVST